MAQQFTVHIVLVDVLAVWRLHTFHIEAPFEHDSAGIGTAASKKKMAKKKEDTLGGLERQSNL